MIIRGGPAAFARVVVLDFAFALRVGVIPARGFVSVTKATCVIKMRIVPMLLNVVV